MQGAARKPEFTRRRAGLPTRAGGIPGPAGGGWERYSLERRYFAGRAGAVVGGGGAGDGAVGLRRAALGADRACWK